MDIFVDGCKDTIYFNTNVFLFKYSINFFFQMVGKQVAWRLTESWRRMWGRKPVNPVKGSPAN